MTDDKTTETLAEILQHMALLAPPTRWQRAQRLIGNIISIVFVVAVLAVFVSISVWLVRHLTGL